MKFCITHILQKWTVIFRKRVLGHVTRLNRLKCRVMFEWRIYQIRDFINQSIRSFINQRQIQQAWWAMQIDDKMFCTLIRLILLKVE